MPLVGYVVAFAQTDLGTVSLVVVPGVLLLVTELHRLQRIRRSVTPADPKRQAEGDDQTS
jgi:hypothetical protein